MHDFSQGMDYSRMDAGIAPWVKLLNENGIETLESCEGGLGHAYPEPTIRLHGVESYGWSALGVAKTFVLPVSELRRTWSFQDGQPHGPYWELVFIRKAESGA